MNVKTVLCAGSINITDRNLPSDKIGFFDFLAALATITPVMREINLLKVA